MTDIISIIDEQVLAEEAERNANWTRRSHYASDINACTRQLWYRWTNVEASNPNTAGSLLKMKAGLFWEEIVAKYLKRAGIEFVEQVHVQKTLPVLKYPIGQRFDFVIVDPADGELTGIEAKSSNGRGVKGWMNGELREEHIRQVATYINTSELTRWYIPCFGRDNAYRGQFSIHKKDGDPMLWIGFRDGLFRKVKDPYEESITRLVRLEALLESHTLPDRDFRVAIKGGEIKDKFQKNKIEYKSAWQCQYCAFRDRCWEGVVEQYKDGDNSEMFNGTPGDEEAA